MLDINSLSEESTTENSAAVLPTVDEMAMPAQRFAMLFVEKFDELIVCTEYHARQNGEGEN